MSQCLSEVRLTPRALPWQTVLERSIETTPRAASLDERKDYYGNSVSLLSILERHDQFSTVATSLVRVDARPEMIEATPAWEQVREDVAAQRTAEAIDAVEFVFDSPYVTTGPELVAFAGGSFTAGRPLMAALSDMTHRIHHEFTYKPTTTTIDTPVLETLRTRRGVCQDFAHLMIGALRSMGLPARYVSGYLRSGADYQGAEASHAWVSAFIPEHGWMDFDPTNDVIPGTGHITLAWGRDYGDVAPVKGVALGGGKQVVEVEVRVDPVEG
ncbi:MAG: transglutaminase family protein [Vicinamibacterales bacterium]